MKRFSGEWFRYHLKNNRLSLWGYSRRFITLYMLADKTQLTGDGPFVFEINNLDHIKCFQETESWHNYDRYTSEAEKNIRNGGHCITAVEDGILIYCSWLGYDTLQSKFTHIGQTIKFPPKTTASYTVYTHPACRGRGIGRAAAKYAARTTLIEAGQDQLIAVVDSNNIPAHRLHVSAGFERVAVLRQKIIMGFKTYHLENIANSFKASVRPEKKSEWLLDLKA